jgi:hypothetical protein
VRFFQVFDLHFRHQPAERLNVAAEFDCCGRTERFRLALIEDDCCQVALDFLAGQTAGCFNGERRKLLGPQILEHGSGGWPELVIWRNLDGGSRLYSGDHFSDDRLRRQCKRLPQRDLRPPPESGDHVRAMIA